LAGADFLKDALVGAYQLDRAASLRGRTCLSPICPRVRAVVAINESGQALTPWSLSGLARTICRMEELQQDAEC
jgi:hypothetical protein